MQLSVTERWKFWEQRDARLALEKPLLKLLPGGLITVKTNAANEVQIRLASNLASLYRHQRPEMKLGGAKRAASSLVYSAISQTNPETGEIVGKTRERKFTKGAKHMIREAGGVLHEQYGTRCWFLTLTLPGSHVTAVETYAKFDKEIKNAFLQNFRKLFAKMRATNGESLDYVCVSELQRRGAIHLHIALGWSSERYARLVKRCYRRWWHKVLLRYSRKTGVDLALREDGSSWLNLPGKWILECAQVEKNVGAYLAKYMSKSDSKLAQKGINSPSRWWSVSKPLQEKIQLSRNAESAMFTYYEDAHAKVKEAIAVLSAHGYDLRITRSAYDGQFMGAMIFPPPGARKNLFEWAKLLCTSSGDIYWDEKRYDWLTIEETSEGDSQWKVLNSGEIMTSCPAAAEGLCGVSCHCMSSA